MNAQRTVSQVCDSIGWGLGLVNMMQWSLSVLVDSGDEDGPAVQCAKKWFEDGGRDLRNLNFPDWRDIPASIRDSFSRTAHKSGGVVTFANHVGGSAHFLAWKIVDRARGELDAADSVLEELGHETGVSAFWDHFAPILIASGSTYDSFPEGDYHHLGAQLDQERAIAAEFEADSEAVIGDDDGGTQSNCRGQGDNSGDKERIFPSDDTQLAAAITLVNEHRKKVKEGTAVHQSLKDLVRQSVGKSEGSEVDRVYRALKPDRHGSWLESDEMPGDEERRSGTNRFVPSE